jgi:hypothetical protein
MKPSLLTVLCLGLLLAGQYGLAGALEIELTGGVNNMTYHPDRVTAHEVSQRHFQFQNYLYGFGDLTLRNEISDKMGFNIHLSRDNILQNSADFKISASNDYLSVEFGPFIGINDDFFKNDSDDSLKKPELGVIGSMRLAVPGVVFLEFNGSTSLGGNFEFITNNRREIAGARVGLWLPSLIPSASASIKSYSRNLADSTVITDELIRFQVSADFFGKNSPLIVRFDGGYEILSRSYDRRGSEIKDSLNAIFVGGEIKWQITQPFCFIAGFEMPIIASVEEGKHMTPPDSVIDLFKAHAGIVITIF